MAKLPMMQPNLRRYLLSGVSPLIAVALLPPVDGKDFHPFVSWRYWLDR